MDRRPLVALIAVAAIAFAAGLWAAGFWAEAGEPAGLAADPGDGPEALREILRLEAPEERAAGMLALLREARPADAPALRQVLEEDRQRVDEIVELLLGAWWARFDPEAAFERRVDPAWEDRHPWLRSVVDEWARRDFSAAADAVDGLSEERRLEATRTLLDAWTRSPDEDPTPLVALLRKLEVKPRGRAIELLLRRMVEERGMEETAAFIAAYPDDSKEFSNGIKNELMGRMGVVMAEVDLERARAWANEHGVARGRPGLGVLLHLAFYWATRDGPAALEWALALEEPQFRRSVVTRAFLSFQRVDREGAAAWLEAQQPTSELRSLYLPYLGHLIAEDPLHAVEIALRAEDAGTRDALLVSVGKQWLRADPDAARAWLQDADLSPEVTEGILERSPPPRPSVKRG